MLSTEDDIMNPLFLSIEPKMTVMALFEHNIYYDKTTVITLLNNKDITASMGMTNNYIMITR